MANYLITGYWGEPHVTAENDRGINAATFGPGRFVLPVGEQFKAEYIGNNTVRIYDGKLIDNGAIAGIPAGEYVDVLIANAGQNMNRNDIIVFQYSQDASTLIESGTFVVVQGAEAAGTAADPELTQEDLLSGDAVFDQMALWRVSVSGTTISAPVQMFSTTKNLEGAVAKSKFLADVDLNTLTETGFYYVEAIDVGHANLHFPTTIATPVSGYVLVNACDSESGKLINQIFIRHGTANSNNNQVWQRSYYPEADTPEWSEWWLVSSCIQVWNGNPALNTEFEVCPRYGWSTMVVRCRLTSTLENQVMVIPRSAIGTSTSAYWRCTNEDGAFVKFSVYIKDDNNVYINMLARDTTSHVREVHVMG